MPPPLDPETLVAAAAAGDRRALARLITVVEESLPGFETALAASFRIAEPATRVGITGAPGAGKSTLTDALIGVIRTAGGRVAVLAVDPTSPFTGGAVLGDRVRMQGHVLDDGVYVRSMASRGHLGGLSVAAPRALTVLEAARYPVILIETVGVGQDEVEVVTAADTVVVVLTPGWGDGIQVAKAGILEIGDVFVVNKADRGGAAETVAELQAMLALGLSRRWTPPIVETNAVTGAGVSELWEAIAEHRAHLGAEGLEERRRRRRRAELESALLAVFRERTMAEADTAREVWEAVAAGALDPWTAARQIAG